MDKKLIPIAVIVAGALIAGAVIYININSGSKECPSLSSGQFSLSEIGEKAISYINQNILQGQGGASLVEVLEENGLYKVKFSIGGQEIDSYVSSDGKLFFPEAMDLEEVFVIGKFIARNSEVCREEGKPVVYFWGQTDCPHCAWEHPIIEKVAGKFGENISFHNNMDSQEDWEVFAENSTGGIPTIVLGCKYYRVGSGEQAGEEEEEKVLTALICKLTGNQPAEACGPVEDLINQVSN